MAKRTETTEITIYFYTLFLTAIFTQFLGRITKSEVMRIIAVKIIYFSKL
jgi:hypothetical protein